MMILISAFMSGLIFGIGLILSGMTDPAKVIGFLDVTGSWDPSLAFVMLGAIAVAYFAFRIATRQSKTILGETIALPAKKEIDTRLIVGSITFGIGWGLAGYCPGPAIASIATNASEPILFSAAMLAGMAIYEVLQKLMPSS
ncbi:MAG: DUF6691 family protein [Candidatus Methylopumilus sp.]|jgi:hypothetical protein